MKKLFLFASLPAALIVSLSAPISVFAQQNAQNTRITVTPVTFSLTSNPGDSLNNVIKVRNDGAVSQQVTVEALDFKPEGEEGGVALSEEDTSSYSLASWIQIDNPSFTLGAGQERNVPFLIRVPGNAEPGGHYASVFAYVSPPNTQQSSGSFIGQRVGSLILLRVAGDVQESATIESFEKVQENPSSPVLFNIRVKNDGSVHVRPQGFVTITDVFNNKVADLKVDERNVLPDSVRRLEANWENPPFIGYFNASVLLQYGENNNQMTSTMTFWILPLKELAIGGAILLVALFILWLGRKRIGKSMAALVGK